VTIDRLLLALQLALAEGRPARRSPRKPLSKVLSSVEGAAAKVVDLSTEGLRLEFGGPAPPALGPFFTLQVPSFGLTTRIKRVWVSAPTHGHLWCGGMLDRVLSKKNSWEYFLETAPSTAEIQFTETKGV
jgi:hypothetical protein